MKDIDISKMSTQEVANLYVEEKQAELAQRGVDRNIAEMETRKQLETETEREALRTKIRSYFK